MEKKGRHLFIARSGGALVVLCTRLYQVLHKADLLRQDLRIGLKKADVDDEDDGSPSSYDLHLTASK